MTIFLPLPKPKMKFRFVLVIVVATTFLFGCDREEEVKPVKVGLPSGPFAIVDISGGSEVGEYPVEFSKSLPADVDNQEYRTDRIIFKWIEKEKFRRGGSRKAAPIHEVELTHGFYMAIFEVTQAQWENVMGPTGPASGIGLVGGHPRGVGLLRLAPGAWNRRIEFHGQAFREDGRGTPVRSAHGVAVGIRLPGWNGNRVEFRGLCGRSRRLRLVG